MNHELSPNSPFVLRLWAYLGERFPPASHGLLILSYYSCNQFVAQALIRPSEPMRYSLATLLGGLTLLAFFFHLRMFDEHKDYDEDCRYFPDRVLQRGLVTLKHLKLLGGTAICFELVAAVIWAQLVSPAPLLAVSIALLFSLLMLKEFFLKRTLRRHFLLYATSHMLIMPLLALIIFSYTTGRFAWQVPAWFWLYAFVGFFVTFNWEISRKIRIPEDELEGVETYTKRLGTHGAAYAVLLVRLIDTTMVIAVGLHLNMPAWFYVVLVLLYGICLIGFLHYRFRTSRATAKRMAAYAGFYIVAFDLTMALALGSKHGVTLTWI